MPLLLRICFSATPSESPGSHKVEHANRGISVRPLPQSLHSDNSYVSLNVDLRTVRTVRTMSSGDLRVSLIDAG